MSPRRVRAECPYCGDALVHVADDNACNSGCPVVTCPWCGSSVAPFLNPDGSVPPGPHTCAHLAVVAPGHESGPVLQLQDMSIASPPALPRVLATRTVSEAMRAEVFGVHAPILAAWRRLTVRPSADAVLHAIVIFRNFNTTVAVVHPFGDMAEVGAVAFADDGIHARGIILGDDRAIRDGFRALAMRLAGDA